MLRLLETGHDQAGASLFGHLLKGSFYCSGSDLVVAICAFVDLLGKPLRKVSTLFLLLITPLALFP